MPRGRHRHAPPLHRLLSPAAVAGVSLACAVVAALSGNVLVLRLVVAVAAATALTAAVLMRSWDRAAGKRVAEVTKARVRDEWRMDERIAELETDLEESREVRQALDAKLRAKRAELSRLRNEYATLLRRYANAETQRASALEGRRLLSLAAGQPQVRELPAGTGGSTQPAPGGLGPAAYRRAHAALRSLVRNGARQEIQRTIDEARRREADEAAGNFPAAAREPVSGPAAALTGVAAARGVRAVPAARAVDPQSDRRSPKRVEGGFDFFGTQGLPAPKGRSADEPTTSAAEDDLADVVGAEAFAEHEAQRERNRADAEREHGQHGQVIDLTEHDETEELDMRELHAHSS